MKRSTGDHQLQDLPMSPGTVQFQGAVATDLLPEAFAAGGGGGLPTAAGGSEGGVVAAAWCRNPLEVVKPPGDQVVFWMFLG